MKQLERIYDTTKQFQHSQRKVQNLLTKLNSIAIFIRHFTRAMTHWGT